MPELITQYLQVLTGGQSEDACLGSIPPSDSMYRWLTGRIQTGLDRDLKCNFAYSGK